MTTRRRQRDQDVGLVLAAPPGELVLRRDAGHHAEIVAALLDGGDVDLHVLPGAVGHQRVARLVDGHRVPLPLDVLHVLRRPELLELLGPDDVAPGDDVPAVPDRGDERLVHQVLDGGAGRVRGDGGELVHLLRGELVPHLGEVALVGAHPAGLGRVADLVDPVDPARPEQRLVQRLRQVGGHHDQHPVLGRGLGAQPEQAADVAVHEAARLLQPGQLGEQGLQRAHAPAAAHAHAHHLLVPGGVRLLACRR